MWQNYRSGVFCFTRAKAITLKYSTIKQAAEELEKEENMKMLGMIFYEERRYS